MTGTLLAYLSGKFLGHNQMPEAQDWRRDMLIASVLLNSMNCFIYVCSHSGSFISLG